jgi:hypothetical protein
MFGDLATNSTQVSISQPKRRQKIVTDNVIIGRDYCAVIRPERIVSSADTLADLNASVIEKFESGSPDSGSD